MNSILKFMGDHPILTVILLFIIMGGLADIANSLRGCR